MGRGATDGRGPQATEEGRGLIVSARQIKTEAALIGLGMCVGEEKNEPFSAVEKDNARIC